MIILIHSSKTMRPAISNTSAMLQQPELFENAKKIAEYLKTVPPQELASVMRVSDKLAGTTHKLLLEWSADSDKQRCAIDSFLGDIYSGLRVLEWKNSDREYANEHLRILSGLYGILRPLDGIYPYRLEMGYKLGDKRFSNLYAFWGDSIAKTLLNTNQPIINLAAAEYSKVITRYINNRQILTPSFLTISAKTGAPTFIAVHAKIARGAFARWLIQNRVSDINQLRFFNDLGYTYNQKLSSQNAPVFICKTFSGLGLSVRLK